MTAIRRCLLKQRETLKNPPEMADQNSKSFDRNGHWVTFNKNRFNEFDLSKTCQDWMLLISNRNLNKNKQQN